MIRKHLIVLGLLLLTIPGAASTTDTLDGFLREGRIKEGLTAFAAPSDNAGRFSLGVLQAMDGLQQFSAGMHNVGINPEFIQSGIPFFRVVTPGRLQSPKEPATRAKVARLFLDWQPVWDQCAHVVFLNPKPAPPLARFGKAEEKFGQWADLIAAVHDMRLKVTDKDGPRRARDEFKAMISCSRVCWQRVLAETDDEKEWLPSPKQTGPGGTKITQIEVDAWQRVLDELDAVSSGRKLLPHWRLKQGVGINVEKLVRSPPPLDLVLLMQGSAFVPYIEEGTVSDRQTWNQLTQVFGPGFFRFAIWSN